MKQFAFISRHAPTESQIALAAEKEIVLTPVGDLDAFEFSSAQHVFEMFGCENPDCSNYKGWDGVVVVHPMLALTFSLAGFQVAVFNNVNRAPVGEKPQFETTLMRVVRPRVTCSVGDTLCETKYLADMGA